MKVITLLTDFGLRDGYVGVMKGVIWKIAPEVKIADLSHAISPQDIMEAAILLWRSVSYFPDGAIHLVVVDPGVGTSRRGIAAQIGSQYYVAPDNGLISLVLKRAAENNEVIKIVSLDRSQYWLPEVSNVFHGRDIFAPVAAHLAAGIPLLDLGTIITDPVMLELPVPVQTPEGWRGKVIHIDHFGNLGSNLHKNHLKSSKDVIVKIKGIQITGLTRTFGERPAGTLIALLDSSGSLAISVVNGSAAQFLNVSIGDDIEVLLME